AVLNSAAYQYYFVPGKVETILGKFSDESGIQNAQVNLSVNGGTEYSLQMFDDSRHNDWGSEDGIYGVSLGPFMLGDHIDYYFSVTDIDNNTITVKGFTADVIQHSSPVNTNGGFEETRVGAAANEINGWKLYNDSPASGGFEIVDDTIEEGNRGLKIEITSLGINPWDIQAVNEPFPVEEKTQYRYFIQAKADKENVKVHFDVEDPSYNAWQSMEANLTTKWQEYSFDFYVPPHSAEARSANWFALKSNSSSLPITLYIDDLRIEKLGTAVSVNDTHSEVPVNFSLNQNYPNPFNPATILSFNIEHKSIVSLKVFDLLGKEIATLVNEEKPAGCYQVQFDASNLSSGVYFYTMETAGFVQTKKMILLH
ncbi:MAG: T9SS type A sorting domain-containing protein, partial [Ignavibacteriaceae bacterium]